MRIVVVGVGGVGMAHVCAAVRQGYEVLALVDTNADILTQREKCWENSWLDHYETVKAQKETKYFFDIHCLHEFNFTKEDLIILATPPNTHIDLVKQCLDNTKARILVEKPYSDRIVFEEDISDRVLISAEWIHHSSLEFVNDIYSLGMSYKKLEGTTFDLPLTLDFCPHLFSIWLSKGYDISSVKNIPDLDDRFSFSINFKPTGYATMWGRRDLDKSGLWINYHLHVWEDDLFDKQLVSIADNKYDLNVRELVHLENLLKEK